jgi:integrase
LQPQTWQGYRGVVERYLMPALGEVALVALVPRQLTAVYAALQHRGGRSGRALSLRTVRYCHAVLHKALAGAVADGVLAANPAARAQLPRETPTADEDDGEHTVWRAEQLRAFLAFTDAHPWAELWRTAAGTGLRRGELVGLRWDDVDVAALALVVRRALEVVDGHARLKRPKSGRSRTLGLDRHTAAALARRRDAQERDRAGGRRTLARPVEPGVHRRSRRPSRPDGCHRRLRPPGRRLRPAPPAAARHPPLPRVASATRRAGQRRQPTLGRRLGQADVGGLRPCAAGMDHDAGPHGPADAA